MSHAKSTRSRLFEKTAAGPGGCVIWTAYINVDGYGTIRVANTRRNAHRVAYELLIGPIPEGMQLDHLCHTRDASCAGGPTCMHRRCVNPYHLEPVTPRQNTLRAPKSSATVNAAKTHCPQGHPYDEANTWVSKKGKRHCRTCLNDHQRKYRAAAAQARIATGAVA